MKQVEGYVERITYRNEENGYSVIYLSNPEPKDDEDDEVCCVGYFSFVSEGEYLVINGRETVHKAMDLKFKLKVMRQNDQTVQLQ